MVQNKGLIFKSVPTDWPVEGKDLTIEDRGFDLDAEPDKNGITIKTYYVSFDPYVHFGAYTSSLSMESSRKTRFGSKTNSLLPTPILQIHSLLLASNADSKTA